MKKLILKTSLITLAGIIVLTGVISLFIGIFSPLTYADMFEKTGANKASMYFYIKNYERDKNINNLHLVVDKAIAFKFNDNIIRYFELLEKQSDYDDFIEFINENNYSATNTVLANVSLSNEDNRLKNRYVRALANTNKFNKAFNYSKDDLINSLGDDENLNFIFVALIDFISEDNYNLFNTVANDIFNKYNELILKYNDLKTLPYNKLTLAKYSSKILEINLLLTKISGNVAAVLPSADELEVAFDSIYSEYREYIR